MNTPSESTTPTRRRIPWSVVLTIILAVVLLYLAFRGVDWDAMLETLRTGRLEYLAAGFGFYSAAYFLRGWRWQVLLSAEKTLHPVTVFWGTAVGYLGNSFLPARAGELIRTALISARAQISASYVLATALTERIIDAALLVLIILFSLSTMDNLPDWMPGTMRGMGIVGALGLIGLFAAPRLRRWILRFVSALPIPERFAEKALNLIEQFLLGMRAVQDFRRAGTFMVITMVLWLFDGLAAVVIAAAFGLELSLIHALLILAALGLASALPSTPGYVGIYQFVAVTVMEPLGFTQNEALVFILALQAVIYAVTITWGVMGLWRLNAGRQELMRLTADKNESAEELPPAPPVA